MILSQQLVDYSDDRILQANINQQHLFHGVQHQAQAIVIPDQNSMIDDQQKLPRYQRRTVETHLKDLRNRTPSETKKTLVQNKKTNPNFKYQTANVQIFPTAQRMDILGSEIT